MAEPTPSQTVGPYLALGLPWADGPVADPDGVRISGRVFDGAGEPVRDALIELWYHDPPAFTRSATDDIGPLSARRCLRRRISPCTCWGAARCVTSPRASTSIRPPTTPCWSASRPSGVTPCSPSAPTMATDSTSASRDRTRPSSSTSADPFDGTYARGAVAGIVDGLAGGGRCSTSRRRSPGRARPRRDPGCGGRGGRRRLRSRPVRPGGAGTRRRGRPRPWCRWRSALRERSNEHAHCVDEPGHRRHGDDAARPAGARRDRRGRRGRGRGGGPGGGATTRP